VCVCVWVAVGWNAVRGPWLLTGPAGALVLFTGSRDRALHAIDVETRHSLFKLAQAHAYAVAPIMAARTQRGVPRIPCGYASVWVGVDGDRVTRLSQACG
jgi:hypothetical protein